MLKKLRIKFIALNMATVAVVLAVIFSAICVINYQQSVASVHEAMSNAIAFTESKSRALTDGDAQGQEGAREQDAGDPDEQADGDWKDDGAQHGTPPQIGGGPAGSGPHVPVAVYRILKSGSYELAESAASASIADDVLEKAISQLADAPDGSGELSELGLFYEKRTSDTGIARVAFADVSSANGWQTLALTLAGVGVVALAVFFVISVFFSRWALRPVKRAWEQQRQFVADASHELKTPLTVILANTSILMSHPERTIASQSQWVESTQAEGERMQGLVADLLLLARLDAEETDIVKSKPKERVDLSNLVEGELLQFESVAFERAIELESNVGEGIAVQGSIACAAWSRRFSTTRASTPATTGKRASSCMRRMATHASSCTTRGRSSQRRTYSTCSTASTVPTRHAQAVQAASAWDFPSRRKSQKSMAAR